jgi:ligand-binding sensor domain-containing protein
VIDPTTPTTLYSSLTGNGVYKKTATANWTAINTGLSNLNVKALAIKPDTTRLFAGTDGGGVFYGDGSGSWAACANTGGGMSNLYIRSLTVVGSTLYAGTAAGVFVSTDNCDTWAAMNTGLPN